MSSETSFLGKFPGRKGRECQPGKASDPVRRSCDDTCPLEQGEPWRRPLIVVEPKLCQLRTQRGLQSPLSRNSPIFFCVHDPAWWWVKASNLGGPGGPVVRFNLAHVVYHTSLHCRWRIKMSTTHHLLCA